MTATALRIAMILALLVFAILLLVSSPLVAIPRTGAPPSGSSVLFGAALIALGIAIVLAGSSRAVGAVAALVGLAWLGRAFGESLAAADTFRGTALAVDALRAPGLFVLAVAIGDGAWTQRRLTRAGVGLAVGAALLATVRVATYDPFLDAACVQCAHTTPIFPTTLGVQVGLRFLAAGAGLAATAGLVLLSAGSLASRGLLGRPRHAVVGAAALCALTWVAEAASTPSQPSLQMLQDPDRGLSAVVAGAATLSGVLLVAALAWFAVDLMRVRVRLRELAADIAAAASFRDLEQRLADAFHDRTLTVGYWLAADRRFVSARGLPVDPPAEGDVGRVTITRAGQAIAAVWRQGPIDGTAVSEALTPSLLLAFDNERLRAESLANLEALTASRARLVAIQDEERRRVERDLHDGIQQRVLGIVFDLRLARTAVQRSGRRAASAWLGRAEVIALALVDDVRRLARGVHPAVLSQAGLAAALSSLADEALIPLGVSIDLALVLPEAVAATIYQVALEVVDDAVRAGAGDLSVAVEQVDDGVVVAIDHDGAPSAASMRLIDRIAAAGGEVLADSGQPMSGLHLRVALPCG
jgi:signal transduction histidine kinase